MVNVIYEVRLTKYEFGFPISHFQFPILKAHDLIRTVETGVWEIGNWTLEILESLGLTSPLAIPNLVYPKL